MIKRIIDYLPALTILLIYLGYCNLHFYYLEFNIDIYKYINNTEILLSFLPTILFGTTIIMFGLVCFMNYIFNRTDSVDKSNNKRLAYTLLSSTLIVVIVYMIYKYYVASYFKIHNYDKFVYPVCIILMYIFLFIGYYFLKGREVFKSNIIFLAIVSMYVLSTSIALYRISEAKEVKKNGSHVLFSCKYNNVLFKTDSILNFIGQTQDYYFFYSKQTKATTILNKDDIDSVTVLNKQDDADRFYRIFFDL